MSVRQIQLGLASVFFLLGGWVLLAPQHVIDTVILPRWNTGDRLAVLTMACFGAQACLAGLFIAFTRFSATTFLAYGIALIPFFVFNWWFTFVDPIFNWLGLIDAVGNIVMLALCVYGWRKARSEDPSSRGD
jgi:hypothetical protein